MPNGFSCPSVANTRFFTMRPGRTALTVTSVPASAAVTRTGLITLALYILMASTQASSLRVLLTMYLSVPNPGCSMTGWPARERGRLPLRLTRIWRR
ncbi:hypothetical protein BJX62DRAFT_217347 [Aspergillus germanicus]